MGWTKSGWINLIGTNVSKTIITPNSIKVGNINCGDVFPYLRLSLRCLVIFGSSTLKGIRVEVYGVDSTSSNKADTIPFWSQDIDNFSNSERILTMPNLDVSSLDSIRVVIRNLDFSNNVSVWVSYNAAYISL